MNLGLDLGETVAILLGEILRADLVLIDERVGRRIARERGVEVPPTSSTRGGGSKAPTAALGELLKTLDIRSGRRCAPAAR